MPVAGGSRSARSRSETSPVVAWRASNGQNVAHPSLLEPTPDRHSRPAPCFACSASPSTAASTRPRPARSRRGARRSRSPDRRPRAPRRTPRHRPWHQVRGRRMVVALDPDDEGAELGTSRRVRARRRRPSAPPASRRLRPGAPESRLDQRRAASKSRAARARQACRRSASSLGSVRLARRLAAATPSPRAVRRRPASHAALGSPVASNRSMRAIGASMSRGRYLRWRHSWRHANRRPRAGSPPSPPSRRGDSAYRSRTP